MRTPFAVLALAATLTVAACADGTGTFAAADDLLLTRGISGPTWVDGYFTLAGGGGGGFAPGENAHPQGLGSCRQANGTVSGNPADNTTWFNPAGHWTNAKFCEGTPAGDRFCTIADVPATYALGSENENLNFELSAAAEPTADLFIHYRTTQNDTRGLGILGFSYDCGTGLAAGGSMDLSGFAADPGNLFGPYGAGRQVSSSTVIVNTPDGNGTGATLHWLYRERVGG